jgi:hypothetical protein
LSKPVFEKSIPERSNSFNSLQTHEHTNTQRQQVKGANEATTTDEATTTRKQYLGAFSNKSRLDFSEAT